MHPNQNPKLDDPALLASLETKVATLKADLAATTQKLQSAQADGKKLGEDLAAGRSGNEKLRQDLDFMVDALPPDPRGGVVEVRAGRVQRKGAALAYEVALTRGGGSKPLSAVLQIGVSGLGANGAEARVLGKPVPLAVGAYEIARGTLALPEGFRASQATISVLDRPDGRQLGMRVLFQMSANDSASLIDSPKAGSLGLNRALFYSEHESRMEVFRPFALPGADWVAQV